jgi:recombinational DNA repair protein RecR
MDRRVIGELGFTVEDPINIDSLNNCAICGNLTENQICDKCREDMYNEDAGCD